MAVGIVEEISVKYDSAEAEHAARRFQRVHDEAMDAAVASSTRAATASQKLGDAQEKTGAKIFQLRMGLFQLGSALAVTGGRTGILINAFAEMGAMMLSGGVLGVGLGAISALLTAYNLIMKDTEVVTKDATKAFKAQAEEIERYRQQTEEIFERVDQGASARRYATPAQGRVGGVNEALERARGHLKAFEEERRQYDMAVYDIGRKLTDEEQRRLDYIHRSEREIEQRIRALTKELELAQSIAQEERDRVNDVFKREYGLRTPELGGRAVDEPDELRLEMPGMLKRGIDFDEQDRAEQERADQRFVFMRDLEQRIADGKLEIRQANEARLAQHEQGALDESAARYDMWAGRVQQSFNIVFDAVLNGLEAMVNGEEFAAEKMAADVLKGIGKQLIGMGIKDAFEGGSRIFRSYGADATGYELLAQGAAEIGAGAAMMAGGLAIQQNIPQPSGGGLSAGGAGYGAGGSTGFDSGPRAESRAGPVVIQVIGALTVEETSAQIARGIDEARAQGLV